MSIKLKVLTILGVTLLLSCEPLDIRGRGYISITTQPTGCEVYLDGEKQSDTTNCVIGDIIKGSDVELRLVKGEYLDWIDTVKVSGVDTLCVDETFTGSLKVTSNPSGASIILDGEATLKTTPHTFDSVAVGPHSLRLEHEGAATLDTAILVGYEEQTNISVELSDHYGYLQVNSTPTDAAIWLDGSNTGYTTNHLLENIGVGSHELKLIKEGYVKWDTTVAVSEGQTETVNATLEEATGSIQVNSTPTGADIYLDDNSTGKITNSLLEDIPVGVHTVKLVKGGYADWQQEVTVNEGQTTTIDADLSVETGNIQVNSTPTGATIYFDNINTGDTTNALFEDISLGSHTVKLVRSGYVDWDTTIAVTGGQTITINADLEEHYPSQVVDDIPVGNRPIGIIALFDGRYVYVGNEVSDNVSVIRTSDNAVIKTIQACGSYGFAVLPNSSCLYVTNFDYGSVSVIETSNNTVIKTISVEIRPSGAAVLPDGKYVYVADGGEDGTVSVIRTSTNTVVKTISVGRHPHGVVALPNGEYVYVSNWADGNVSVIRTLDNTVTNTIQVGSGPDGVTVLPNGEYVYVANDGSSTVSVIRTSDNTVIKTVLVGSGPNGVTVLPNGEYVYVANSGSNTVSVIRTWDNTVIKNISVGDTPFKVAVFPNGEYVYVTNGYDNNVLVIGY